MLTKFTVLETDPNTIDIELLPEQMGEYEEKCKICRNRKGRRIVDYLYANGIARKKIVAYCNQYKLYEPLLNETNMGLHCKKHVKVDGRTKRSLAKVETELVKQGGLKSIEEWLRSVPNEQISEDILRKAVAPYYGGRTPQLREAVALLKAVQDKKAEETNAEVLKAFFKSAKENPIVDGKVKRKIKVSPAPGIEISQTVEG